MACDCKTLVFVIVLLTSLPRSRASEPPGSADVPAAVSAASAEASLKPESTLADAPLPLVQLLLPGFRVRELPVQLTNVNNVRFRDDGQLVTLGYNGDVHLLSDSDQDGLEDHVQLFWKNEGSLRGPIGMLLTPGDYPLGRGLFTPSKGKLSLIVDQDGDDRADKEIIVAEGWEEIAPAVDATGIAMSPDGWLYFGLGTADYSNAYQVDQQGQAHYRLASDRGTVQRVSPDFKTRETVCTGIRFPIAFAFNDAGDLFCTEQEGATWLANGNPFDELLHVQVARHYGFPPRHPRHNPDVIDEPSTFDFAPQHQSTCGMVFNTSVNGGPAFGPAAWAGDALICGESRGKLWRTSLMPTEHGYVAATQLLACLQMLTVDACVAPNGDLVVACHSGPPDWGTGPTGIGKLFRIEMNQPDVPRPTAVWAAGEREIAIAWDRPLDPLELKNLASRIQIELGEYVRAGDRFETLAPPYVAVKQQSAAQRTPLAVEAVSVGSDLRTLFVATEALSRDVHYAITLPSFSAVPASSREVATTLVQQPQIDLDFTLAGLECQWRSGDESLGWSGWLPHFNWSVADSQTQQSALHDELRDKLETGGVLTLRTRMDLSDVLRPQQQPGTSLDFQWPEETVTIVLRAAHPLHVDAAEALVVPIARDDGHYEWQVTVRGAAAANLPLQVGIEVQAGQPLDWTMAMFTGEDERLRPVPLHRFHSPWVNPQAEPSDDEQNLRQPLPPGELAGGDWGRGRRVFHSAAAGCFQCHATHGIGAKIGPDLGNLPHRDYAAVLRDIQHPSYAINPDYIAQIVVTHDGQALTGVIRTEQNELVIGQADGKLVRLAPSEVASMKIAETSIMPTGVVEKLTPTQLRDLMTYLLMPPPHMPTEGSIEAPPLRTQAEVAAVLAGAPSTAPSTATAPVPPRELKIVLVAGTKDHGPGEHDYPAWQIQWAQLLGAAGNTTIETAWDFPSDDQLTTANVLIFFQKGDWNDQRQTCMDGYFERGGGAVYIHWAVNGNDRVADFSKRIGLASRGGSISYRHGPLSLIAHNTDHPIMRNIDALQLYDESYWLLTGDPENVTLFASSVEDGQSRPQVWGYERQAGRVFVSIPGHYNWTFDDPIFRTLLLRGIAWTAKEPVDRFNELVPLGARMTR